MSARQSFNARQTAPVIADRYATTYNNRWWPAIHVSSVALMAYHTGAADSGAKWRSAQPAGHALDSELQDEDLTALDSSQHTTCRYLPRARSIHGDSTISMLYLCGISSQQPAITFTLTTAGLHGYYDTACIHESVTRTVTVWTEWHLLRFIPGHLIVYLNKVGNTKNKEVQLLNPANTKHLYNICTMLVQRRRLWSDVVQMLCKCFVFAGKYPTKSDTVIWQWQYNNPWSADIFLYKLRHNRIFSVWDHHTCLSQLFLLYLNTYVMSLRPL